MESKWLKVACVMTYFVSLPMVFIPICLGPFLWAFDDPRALANALFPVMIAGGVLGYAPFILIAVLRKVWREEPEHLPQTSSRSAGGELQTLSGSYIRR